MILVCFKGIGSSYVANKYSDKIIEMYINSSINPNTDSPIIISTINEIKQNLLNFEVIIINFCKPLLDCLTALKMDYILIYPDISCKDQYIKYWSDWSGFDQYNSEKILLKSNEYLENYLQKIYDWVHINNSIDIIPEVKSELTFEKLIQEDVIITENDVRDLKTVENKLKVRYATTSQN